MGKIAICKHNFHFASSPILFNQIFFGISQKLRNVFPDRTIEKILNIVIQLIDTISSKWSDKQALAVTGALQGWKQEKIAKTLWEKEVSQQAVAQHLSRAGWYSVERGGLFFEQFLEESINKHK